MTRERMPRRLRNTAIGVGLTIFLALSATGVHAAWTASTSKSATATNGTIGITSSGIDGLGTSYASQNQSAAAKLITLTNSGSTPLTISYATVTNEDPLGGVIRLALWPKPAGACQSSPPTGAYTTFFTGGVKILSGMPSSVNPGTSVQLCAVTTFTGDPATYAGQSITPSLAFTGTVGTSWSAAGSAQQFTQSVAGVPNPLNVKCTTVAIGDRKAIDITWEAAPATVDGYVIVYRGTVHEKAPSGLTIRFEHNELGGQGTTLTVHAVVGGQRSGGIVVPILRDPPSISCVPAA
ncbi:hypothetical protein [Cryobacterium sp. BB307]|uniref:hypothetical protein n=1 Tax=Cryobacterium sp. BB307 TaxID=2716317 RepID=UPI00144783C0|nr:hypothetical protein [Cryobacterium sp. BB307]